MAKKEKVKKEKPTKKQSVRDKNKSNKDKKSASAKSKSKSNSKQNKTVRNKNAKRNKKQKQSARDNVKDARSNVKYTPGAFAWVHMWITYVASMLMKDQRRIPDNIGNKILITNNMYVTYQCT